MAQQNNIAYGLSSPLLNVFPGPVRAQQAPTVEDKLTVGQWWIDEVANQAYILTSITNNQANWSTLTIMGVGVFNAVESTLGNITADVGNIVATLGNISAGGTITSGGSLTVATGDLGVLVGDLNVNLGNVIVTTGNVRVTAGDIDTVAGDINSAGALTAGTTITAASNITSSAGNITATTGNIAAPLGSLTAGTTISAGTGITTTAGGFTATAGNITATTGSFSAPAGDLTVGGNITTNTGTILADIINCNTVVSSTGFNGVLYFNLTNAGLNPALQMRGVNFAHMGFFPVFSENNFFGLDSGNNVEMMAAHNTAVGSRTLSLIADGATYNTTIGNDSMANLTLGSYNMALGYQAANVYTGAESSNICIGNVGVLGENNTIHIGTDGVGPGQQSACFIAGDVTVARGITATTGDITTSTAGKGIVVGGGAKVISGAGDPNGVVTAPKGSLYLNLTGSAVNDRAWINTNGITAWTFIVTGA